jgi:fibronectin-binding autotransporter adhesin
MTNHQFACMAVARFFPVRGARVLLALSVLATALATPAAAQTTYSVAGTGLWSGSATWSPTVVGGPLATDVIAIVNPALAATVSLGGTSGSAYNIASITHSGSSAIIFQPSTTVSDTGVKTLAVAGDVRVNGSGLLTFRQAATPNLLTLTVGGNLLVDSGTLAIGTNSNNPAPTFTLTGSTVVASGATLAVGVSSPTLNRTVLNGTFSSFNSVSTNASAAGFLGLSGTGSIVTVDGLAASTFSVGLSNTTGSFTYAGSITQAGTNTTVAIQKSNAGRQVLSGALTYSGATTINGGVLQFDSAMPATTRVVFGSTTGTSVLGLGFGNLAMNTGQSAGQVHFINNAVGGFAAYNADRTVTLNGGAVLTWGTNSFMGVSGAGGGTGQLVLGSDTADAKVTFINDINLNGATRTILVPDGPARYEGELSGVLSNGGIRKQGAGVLRLTGSAATGITLQSTAGVAAIAGSGTYGGNFFLDGGVLGLGNGDLTRALGTGNGQVRLTADGAGFAAFDADRTVNIGGGTSLTWATTSNFFSVSGSTMVLNVDQSDAKLTFANNLGLGTGATRTIQVGNGTASVDAAITGTISGASNFVKTGAGVLELSAANTFSGATTITAGQLRIAAGNINSSSGITINGSGAELKYNSATALTAPITLTQGTISGTGTIGTAVTVDTNDVISPGNSPGIQAYTSLHAWAPGGTYKWELNALTGSPGTNWDLVNVTSGTFSLAALAATPGNQFVLDLTTLGAGDAAGQLVNPYDGGSYTFAIASYNPANFLLPIGFSNTAGADLTSLFTFNGLANWQGTQPQVADISVKINSTATGIDLVIVPEPGALALVGLGVAAAAWAAHRRRCGSHARGSSNSAR